MDINLAHVSVTTLCSAIGTDQNPSTCGIFNDIVMNLNVVELVGNSSAWTTRNKDTIGARAINVVVMDL